MAKTESPFTVRLDSKQARALTQAAVRAGGFDQLKAADVERIASAEASTDAAPKPSKYRNVRRVVDGETFDSKKEAQHWHELKLREKNGEICELRRQEAFDLLTISYEDEVLTVATYVADFVFRDVTPVGSGLCGQLHVQDVKGGRATQTQLYKLKKKWLELQSGIVIEEV